MAAAKKNPRVPRGVFLPAAPLVATHFLLGLVGLTLQLFTAALDVATEASHRVAARQHDAQCDKCQYAFHNR